MVSDTIGKFRSLFDDNTVSKGVGYYLSGRVNITSGEGSPIVASVKGSGGVYYLVFLEVGGRSLKAATCNCPVGTGRCKHIFATLIEHFNPRVENEQELMAERREAVRLTSPSRRSGVGAKDELYLDMGAKKLDKLVELYGLSRASDYLDTIPYYRLRYSDRDWITSYGAAFTFRDVLISTRGMDPAEKEKLKKIPLWIRHLALDELQESFSTLKTRLEQEVRWAPQRRLPPSGRMLAELHQSLRDIRERMREQLGPPPVTDDFVPFSVSIDDLKLTTRYRGASRPCPASHAQITFELFNGHAPPDISCNCGDESEAVCPLKLGAVDALTDFIFQEELCAELQAVERQIATPIWSRRLKRLDATLSLLENRPAEEEPEGRLFGWKVQRMHGGFGITPVLTRPYRSKAGLRTWKLNQLDNQDLGKQDFPVLRALGGDPWSQAEHADLQTFLALVGHPRVVLEGGRVLQVYEGQLRMKLRKSPTRGVAVDIILSGRTLSVEEASELASWGEDGGGYLWWDSKAGIITVIPGTEPLNVLMAQLAHMDFEFEPEATSTLLSWVPRFGELMPVELGENLRGTEVDASTTLRCQLDLSGTGLRMTLGADPLEQGIYLPPGEGQEVVLGERPGTRIWTKRDFLDELRRLNDIIDQLPGIEPQIGNNYHLDDLEQALEVVATLQLLSEAEDPVIAVTWQSLRASVHSLGQASAFQVSVQREHDWFRLDGYAQVDGFEIPLEDVIRAVRGGNNYVNVKGNTWVKISREVRETLDLSTAGAFDGSNGLEVSMAAAQQLELLAEAGALVDVPEQFTLQLRNLKEAQKLRYQRPKGLKGRLRPYQKQGITWLQRISHWSPGACLADDMGLGKTLQAIALLLGRGTMGPALVVAPTSVGFNWVDEFLHFAPSLSIVSYRGPGRQSLLETLAPNTVLVTSYDIVLRDIALLENHDFATVVLDEAQAIKNANAKRSRAIRRLSGAFKLALTGTPVENHAGEVWSLFAALVPGLMGSAKAFKTRFLSIRTDQDGAARARRDLAQLMAPFVLRRTKAEVASDLPDRIEEVIHVEMSSQQVALYRKVRSHLLDGLSGDSENRMAIFAALTRLRQLACHPKLVDKASTVPSAKLQVVCDLVQSLRDAGHRCLIFSQFTGHLALVRQSLELQGASLLYLDGQTPANTRKTLVTEFQKGETDCFLISLKAGGTGLNLTAATYVIHLDPWWNPAAEDQASDRAHRIGQKQTVTIYRLVSRGTIEEEILNMHKAKRELVSELLGGTGQASTLKPEEMLRMIRSH